MGHLKQVPDVAAGLAIESDLLAGRAPAVGLWTASSRALVCPEAYRRRPGFAEAAVRSEARGWPLLTRPTGGGAVPQGPGVMNIALAFTTPRGFLIEDGYRLLTGAIRTALGPNGRHLETGATPQSFCDGAWNLAIGGRKVVGTAQRWRGSGEGHLRVLAHALILTGGDVAPGAAAVDALHADLGLPPVRAEVHVTLAEALGDARPTDSRLADAMHDAATVAIHGLLTKRGASPD